MEHSRHTYESLLDRVEKPGRYLGNEPGAVRKDPKKVALRLALAFPEVYEIGQSHLGLQLLYDLLNRRPDVYAERVYTPWHDLEALLREHRQPLVSLETGTPLSEFHVIGFSLQYELTYTNVLTMLDLGGIPLRSADRSARDPLVVAGGPCAFNPEPLADVLDAVLLGDGEEAVGEICEAYLRWDRTDRQVLLQALSRIEGVYIPGFYEPVYASNGHVRAVRPLRSDVPSIIRKRVVRDLNSVPMPQTLVVPTIRVVHGRPSLEVMRGCVKGCRFCQAGYVYRPVRERDPRSVLAHAAHAVTATGTDELSLLSLSTGDYSCINPVLTELMNRFSDQRVAVSLPSTRVDALAPALLEQIRRVRKTGFTLAPEAGSQRMRDVIQKAYHEEELIEAARQIFALGWRSLKLYFMLGLPGETEEDLLGIVDLSAAVAATSRRRSDVTAAVSTFVPKPHTPFQWAAQTDLAETQARQSLLRRELGRHRIRFKWHDARTSQLEGIFARGDRRLGRVLMTAYELGCRFDGWTEHCRFDLWERALAESGMSPQVYLRRRDLNELLPWDHLSGGPSRQFLQRELAHAVEGRLTPDCSIERCTDCGACNFTTVRNVTYHVKGAKGSEHRGEQIDRWARTTVGSSEEPGSWEPRGWHKIEERTRQRSGTAQVHRSPGGRALAPPTRDALRDPEPRGAGSVEEWLGAPPEGLTGPPVTGTASPKTRVRITYRKRGPARFISHLELIDLFARSCRRARVPLAFSSGYRPQPRLRFSPGLSLGTESSCELLDIDLTESVAPNEIANAFDAQLPDGLAVLAAEEISLQAPSPEHGLLGFRYRVTVTSLCNGNGSSWIDRRLASFTGAKSFAMRKRSGKGEREIDARPFVARLVRPEPAYVELDIRFTSAGSIKPSDLLGAILGLEPLAARALPIRKTHAFYRNHATTTGQVEIGST